MTNPRGNVASPFWANEFRLISLKELLMERYAPDEIHLAMFSNALYALGRIGPGTPSAAAIFEISLSVMERLGMHGSLAQARTLIQMLQDDHSYSDSTLVGTITAFRATLHAELDGTVFLPINPEQARFYREPRRDWQEVIGRFAPAAEDIEEASRCYALGRYAASIYHCMQVLEFGLLELGKLLKVTDPKSGFTAVSNELERFLKRKWDGLSDAEKKSRPFFEQINMPIQAIKDACRNKVSHAEGRAVLLRADFSPRVTMEIYTQVRAFMRRLATEMPS